MKVQKLYSYKHKGPTKNYFNKCNFLQRERWERLKRIVLEFILITLDLYLIWGHSVDMMWFMHDRSPTF